MDAMKKAGGFYAALSLGVAMVGAGCWYAWSHGGAEAPPRADVQKPAVTSAETALTTTAHRITVPTTTATTTENAEAAAALLRPSATETTATTAATVFTTTTQTETEQPPEAHPLHFPIVPIAGQVGLPFSNGELVRSGTTGIWATHNGTDFLAPLGSEVYAVMDGTVTAVERNALWGVCVSILHESGTVTRYCGLNEELGVQAGDIVRRGTVLGTLGATNEAESADESHLHFEVLVNDCYINPEEFLLHGDGMRENA